MVYRYGNFSTQMAGFQLAGPAADVSKSLYGDFRKSYQSPNAQCDNSGAPTRGLVKCTRLLKSCSKSETQPARVL